MREGGRPVKTAPYCPGPPRVSVCMAKSCKGLFTELAKCLSDSPCVKVRICQAPPALSGRVYGLERISFWREALSRSLARRSPPGQRAGRARCRPLRERWRDRPRRKPHALEISPPARENFRTALGPCFSLSTHGAAAAQQFRLLKPVLARRRCCDRRHPAALFLNCDPNAGAEAAGPRVRCCARPARRVRGPA